MKQIAISIITCCLLASCSSLPKQTLKNVESIKAKEEQSKIVNTSLEKKSKVYVDASIKALEAAPQNKETSLALRFLKNTQEIMGPPLPSERIDVAKVFKEDPEELRKLAATETLYQTELIERQKLNEELLKLKNEVVRQAEDLAHIQNKSWYTKLKENIATYIILLVGGALIAIFFPLIVKTILRLIKPI